MDWKIERTPSLWDDMIGQEVSIVFNLPSAEWPIDGYPAWAIFEGADSGLVRFRVDWDGPIVVVGAHAIKSIRLD